MHRTLKLPHPINTFPPLIAAIVFGFATLIGPVCSGQIIYDDFELLAIDGAEHDVFGESIAIDDGIVAVGAMRDDDNGIDSGSVYLFDASTGRQLRKLVPSDGAAGDLFGNAISICNGVVAVGAYHKSDNGQYSGAAYLFDTLTGYQIAKLLPNDGSADDIFGYSIALDQSLCCSFGTSIFGNNMLSSFSNGFV